MGIRIRLLVQMRLEKERWLRIRRGSVKRETAVESKVPLIIHRSNFVDWVEIGFRELIRIIARVDTNES